MAAPPTTTLPCVCPLRIEGFPGGSDGKESPGNVGDLGLIPGLGISPEVGLGNPLQCSCLENPHGQRNLVGYSPWGHKELDMTERLKTTMILQQKLNSEDKFPRAFLKTHSFSEKMSLLTSLPERNTRYSSWCRECGLESRLQRAPPPSTSQGQHPTPQEAPLPAPSPPGCATQWAEGGLCSPQLGFHHLPR